MEKVIGITGMTITNLNTNEKVLDVNYGDNCPNIIGVDIANSKDSSCIIHYRKSGNGSLILEKIESL